MVSKTCSRAAARRGRCRPPRPGTPLGADATIELKTSPPIITKVLPLALAGAALSFAAAPVFAQQAPAPAAPAAPAANPMATPAMSGPLAANPNPTSFDLGPLGKTYVTGVLSGIGFWQDNDVPGLPSNRAWEADISNGTVAIQKTDGLIQYFIQAGVYSLPALGTPYLDASHSNSELYGPLPEAYVKLAPTGNFSIMAGKLPTLIGAEYTYTFENMNIERGLLWNQENVVNRGVQLNYTVGPLAFALSWNDGFYSDDLTWLTGSATWTIDPADSLTFAGGGNTTTTTVSTTATPGADNNAQMFDLSYTRTMGPWTVNPYIQYTHVPTLPRLGFGGSGSTMGGALLVNYSFDPSTTVGGLSLAGVSVPFRVEYISSKGGTASPNLLYGPGSNAWSFTVTPTYQYKIFFARTEFAYVGTSDITAGDAFGHSGTAKSQVRMMVESGFLF